MQKAHNFHLDFVCRTIHVNGLGAGRKSAGDTPLQLVQHLVGQSEGGTGRALMYHYQDRL